MGKIFRGIINVQPEGAGQKNECPSESYTVQIEPSEMVDVSTKEVSAGENATFTYTGTLRTPKITCTNNQSGKIEGNIITINKVTNNTTCSISSSKHTVQIKVENGTTTETEKEVNTGEETTFKTTPNTGYSSPTVTCTNSQKGIIQNNTVTVSKITNDTTCTVTYKPITYTITYNLGGGSVTGNPATYTIETNTITLKNPTKTGYTFTGWTGSNGSTPQTTVTIPKGSTGNKSYTANYKANTYQIKYNSNGGAGTMSNSTHTYGESKALSTNTFTKTGYTFQGWSTSSTSNTVKYTNGQNVTNLTSTNGEVINLYAVWKINTYTVKVTVANGTISGSTSKTVNYNTNATFTVTPSTGYSSPTITCTNNQKGTIQNNTVTITNITNDTTCTVEYTANTYQVKYNSNGGSGTMANSTHTYGVSKTLSANAFTREGYTFLGWSTNSNALTADFTNEQGVSNLTSENDGVVNLYAVWKINIYTVNVVALNGTINGDTTKEIEYNGSDSFSLTASDTGYDDATYYCDNATPSLVNNSNLIISDVKGNATCVVEFYEPTNENCFAFDSATNTVTDYYDYVGGGTSGTACPKDVGIPSTINSVEVNVVGEGALREKELNSIKLPNTINSLESSAIMQNNISSVVIPNSVTNLGSLSFYDNQISEIVIPDTVTNIEGGVFTKNQLSEDDAYIYDRKEDGSIDKTRFMSYGGTKTKDITLPEGIVTIGAHAFRKIGMEEVDVPESVITIEERAYAENNLTEVVIPNNVETIGKSSFSGGNKITSLTLGDSVKVIEPSAFSDNLISSLTLPESLVTLNGFAGNKITSIIIPNNVETIGEFTFYKNQLTSATIGSSVQSIGNYAFSGNKLTTITIPNSVKTIGRDAFAFNSLTKATIGTGVTRISQGAFACYANSNPGLSRIVNKTGRAFNWGLIIRNSSGSIFVTGTHSATGIRITSS